MWNEGQTLLKYCNYDNMKEVAADYCAEPPQRGNRAVSAMGMPVDAHPKCAEPAYGGSRGGLPWRGRDAKELHAPLRQPVASYPSPAYRC